MWTSLFDKVADMKTSTLTCIVLLCSAASAQPPKWTNVENWRLKLEPYMATHQVRLLLGDPIDREVGRLAQIWYYEKAPTREAGKVVKRPTSGIVRFERQKTIPRTNRTPPQPTFVVISFTEPDWPNVPPDAFKSRQQLAREQQAQAALERRKAMEEQRLQAAQKTEALAKERQQQLEAARKGRQALFEERRRQVLARVQADETPAPEEPENLLSKYLYAIGTITLTIAAVVFLKKRYL